MSHALTERELAAIQMMIGQQVLGFVATSTMLGHTSLRGSTVYAKGSGPVGKFVWQVMTNKTADAFAALDALIKEFPSFAAELSTEDTSTSTGIDSARAWLQHCVTSIDH